MPAGAPGFTGSAHTDERAVRHTLLLIARALRFGRVGLLYAATGSAAAAARLGTDGECRAGLALDLQEPYWLAQRLAEQVDRLRLRLIEIERQWNIEGAPPFHR